MVVDVPTLVSQVFWFLHDFTVAELNVIDVSNQLVAIIILVIPDDVHVHLDVPKLRNDRLQHRWSNHNTLLCLAAARRVRRGSIFLLQLVCVPWISTPMA